MLNVAAIHEVVRPRGARPLLMVWLQGCRKRCRGCMNEDFLPLVDRLWMTSGELLERLHDGLEGICFSGGEPFLQAEELAIVAREARTHGFATLAYSGYTLEELAQGATSGAAQLLRELDVLIDGEFVEELAGSFGWRGSSNQRIHRLTNRYGPELLDDPPSTDVRLTAARLRVVGTANPAVNQLLQVLSELGVQTRDGVTFESQS
jgi:anaerobic ribonucleoside-triphosphate reductase activating protein